MMPADASQTKPVPSTGRVRAFFSSRYPWAIGAGLVLASAFPKVGIAGLAWLAPALILLAAYGRPGKQAFRIGYVAGLAHYLATLYWLLLIPVPWTWAWAKALGWLALGGFLALFTGTWTWLCWKIFPARGELVKPSVVPGERSGTRLHGLDPHLTPTLSPPSEGAEREPHSSGYSARGGVSHHGKVEDEDERKRQGLESINRNTIADTLQTWAAHFLTVPWSLRLSWVVGGAAIWVALEMLVSRIFGGFPWNLLGDSQYQMTPLIQIAGYTGVYGVSFLVVWSSLSLIGAAMVIIGQPTRRSAWVGEIMLPMLTVTGLYLAGYEKLLRPEAPSPELSVALVQPSVPQTMIWDEADSLRRFKDLLRVSERALSNKPDLLLWPESAVPSMVRFDPEISDPVAALAREHKVWIILNSDDAEPLADETNIFNSAFLISPEGRLAAEYKKQHLVIFGEYVPLSRTLPFLKWLTPISGGFTPGDRAVQFELSDLHVETSVLICFEDAFPQLARQSVNDDTDFLVNLTNDGWFGEGAAQWQHAACAVFRTVENGVPLVRCANNGLTCWVDASGRIREKFVSGEHGIYGPGYMMARIPLLLPNEHRVPTFYRRHGDAFGWACVALAGLRVLRSRRSSRADKSNNG